MLIIEIDFEENKHLLDDLTKIFFSRKFGQRRAEKKNWTQIRSWKFVF